MLPVGIATTPILSGGSHITASPRWYHRPPWARQHKRNLALFTPPAEIVFGDYSPAEYEQVYWETLRPKWKAIKAWVAAQGDTHVILLCACGDGKFCHRLLIRQLLLRMGAHEIALEDVKS